MENNGLFVIPAAVAAAEATAACFATGPCTAVVAGVVTGIVGNEILNEINKDDEEQDPNLQTTIAADPKDMPKLEGFPASDENKPIVLVTPEHERDKDDGKLVNPAFDADKEVGKLPGFEIHETDWRDNVLTSQNTSDSNKEKKETKEPVKALDVGSYKDLKSREVVGDGLEHDHIPSFAALRIAKERELNRPLTKNELKELYNNATVVEVPKDIHAEGRTYRGKNTPTQIQEDSRGLCDAQCKDLEVHRKNFLERGYKLEEVEEMIRNLKFRNEQMGIK